MTLTPDDIRELLFEKSEFTLWGQSVLSPNSQAAMRQLLDYFVKRGNEILLAKLQEKATRVSRLMSDRATQEMRESAPWYPFEQAGDNESALVICQRSVK
jgi:hypothetical protein